MEAEPLENLKAYALLRGYEATLTGDGLILYNVANLNNNFRIAKADGYYAVVTLKISEANYEYTAKCMVYLLMAEFNKENADAGHLHINYKVDL